MLGEQEQEYQEKMLGGGNDTKWGLQGMEVVRELDWRHTDLVISQPPNLQIHQEVDVQRKTAGQQVGVDQAGPVSWSCCPRTFSRLWLWCLQDGTNTFRLWKKEWIP